MASTVQSKTGTEERAQVQPQGGQTLIERTGEEISSAREHLRGSGDAMRAEARTIADAVRHKVGDSMESGKSVLADSLDDFSAAIRKASDELSERDQRSAANLVRHAAEGLQHATAAVKGRSVEEIAGSVADFARERPTTFIIGAVLAGLALGRFARSSSPYEPDQGDDYDY